jgi:preprotein translocase subunit SecA
MRMFGSGALGDDAPLQYRSLHPAGKQMLSRLVEQAQERVGRQHDIANTCRYDDVLNDQRERIYKERDRVLVKEDMEEDVLEMLRSELKRRIPEALNDPEGPWKLLAYLDEIQPTIIFGSQNERVISFTLLTIAGMLDELVGGAAPAAFKLPRLTWRQTLEAGMRI